MSSVVISGDTSGTITLQAPAVSGSTTLNLPATNGTVALTADIPAAGGMTLLGTVTTTSGTSQGLTGLTLTGYKSLYIVFNGVSTNSPSRSILLNTTGTANSGTAITVVATNATDSIWGTATADLTIGWVTSMTGASTTVTGAAVAASEGLAAITTLTTSATQLTFTPLTSGSFDAGSISVYGVK